MVQLANPNTGTNGDAVNPNGQQLQPNTPGTGIGSNTGNGTVPNQGNNSITPPPPPPTITPTWKNGITRQTEDGFPPAGWDLGPDGFWYPPTDTTPNNPSQTGISLSDIVTIQPSADTPLSVTYVQGSGMSLPTTMYTFTNTAGNMTVNVTLSGVPGIVFDVPSFTLPALGAQNVVVSFNGAQLDSLPEGLNSTNILVMLTAGTITVQPPISIIPPPPQPPTQPGQPINDLPQNQPIVVGGSGGGGGTIVTNTGGGDSGGQITPGGGTFLPSSVQSAPGSATISITPPPPPIIAQPTWKNGLTRQVTNGTPPANWVLLSDGFYYPPQQPVPPTLDFTFTATKLLFDSTINANVMNGIFSVAMTGDDRTTYSYQWNLDVLGQGSGVQRSTNNLDFLAAWKVVAKDVLNASNNGTTTRTVEVIATKGTTTVRTQKVITFPAANVLTPGQLLA